jgi:predicted nucleic acid-binding protein
VSKVVLLDAGPLGLLCAPPNKANTAACRRWLSTLVTAGVRVIVPEMPDYEVRRELIRLNKTASLTRLDALALATEYLPLTTPAMRRAAELWAIARQTGQPTAGDNTIDADVILIAQAQTLGVPGVVIATTNVGHLSRFTAAEVWTNISP